MPTEDLLAGRPAFRQRYAAQRALYRRLAEEGQHPRAMWIGCADSRVPPEEILGVGAGELFVLRNVANIVPPAGHPAADGVGSAIEYAVEHLHVGAIIVAGHTDCGGIKALEGHLDAAHDPHVARWLELARPARAAVLTRRVPEADVRLETIRANVLLQREHVRGYPCVAAALAEGRLTLHAWVYDLATGDLWAYDDATRTWAALPG